MRKGTQRLRLGMASLQYSDSHDQLQADVRKALHRGPHVLGLSELGARTDARAVATVAREAGYRSVHLTEGRSDFAFLVRRAGVQLLDHGREFAHPTGPRQDDYEARWVDWVKLGLGDERIFVHGLHWVVPKTPRRRLDHARATAELIDTAEKHAAGRHLSFWLGDINVRDDPADVDQLTIPLQRAGMLSVWDELGVYPATHGLPGPIDVIGRMRRDGRVSAETVAVHRRGVYSDHHQVNAAYLIAP